MKMVSESDDRVDFPFEQVLLPNGYVTNLVLRERLYDNPDYSIELLARSNHVHLHFCEKNYYFLITGLPKRVYRGAYGLGGKPYMEISTPLLERVEHLLENHGFLTDCFMVWREDEKQLAVVMSPSDHADCDALRMAQLIDEEVQATYERELFAGDTRYRNMTSLSEPLHSLSDYRAGYQQAHALNLLSFFSPEPRCVMTEAYVQAHCNNLDYTHVLSSCMQLRSALDSGNEHRTLALFRSLFDDKLRNSLSLSICRDALSYIQCMLQTRGCVYGLPDDIDLAALCAIDHYLLLSECAKAIWAIMRPLCRRIAQQGSYSHTVLDALYFIRTHYHQDIALTDAADYANTHVDYLSRLFKEETGLSIREYITDVRLEAACRLLRADNRPLASIAGAVGFNNVRYFTRVFKQHLGMTPTAYRLGCAGS